jgi:hypothetical protein
MSQQVHLQQKITTQVWATPAPGISLRQLAIKFLEDGQQVLQIDWHENRILLHRQEE